MKAILVFIATLGPVGTRLPAPGTMGSALAVIAGGVILASFGHGALVVALVLAGIIGFPAASAHFTATGKHDAGEVIIDEVIGQWLALLVMPQYGDARFFPALIAAFVLFRFFDIAKPFPVNRAENLPGAGGVIADDVVAGIMAGICLMAGLAIAGRFA